MTLADVLPDEDYRFQFRFDRAPVAEFFQPGPANRELLAQRKHCLAATPETCVALLPEGVPLLEETVSFARSIGCLADPVTIPVCQDAQFHSDWLSLCIELGRNWEPDFLLLRPDPAGSIRLVAGCVCFPSSWSLEEKIGRPIEEIHGVVPSLNSSIGPQIHRFLSKLRPGTAWLRANWGLSRSPELNQHPARRLPRLDAAVNQDEVWLRIEHQALVALPLTSGVLFGIRLAIHPLREILAVPVLAQRLSRALKTMPDSVADYKGIAQARTRLILLLDQAVNAGQAD